MRRWKDVGSVQSINSRQNSEVKSNRSRSQKSRKDSPFCSFHQNIQNQSDNVLDQKQTNLFYSYMERKREGARAMTFEMGEKGRNSLRGEDMFTEMRNVLKYQDYVSRVTTKSLSDPESNINTGVKGKGKQILKKTNSKIKKLKKQQGKLKKDVQTDVASIKNMFYQLEDIFDNFKSLQKKQEEKQDSCDPQFLREIVLEAMSVEKYFQEQDRKKKEIMDLLELE